MKAVSLFAIGYERADRILSYLEKVFGVDNSAQGGQENLGSVSRFKEIGERAAKVNGKLDTSDWRKRFCMVHDRETMIPSDSNHHWPDETVTFCKNCGLCL